MRLGITPGQEIFAISADSFALVFAPMLLVHSPLLGASSWERFAEMASSRGHRCVVADLTGVATAGPPGWEYYVDSAVAAGGREEEPLVVVGHSGAGVFLPLIADRLGDGAAAVVLVDAVVPPAEGRFRVSPAMRQLVDSKTVDGTLLPWMDWWPRDLMEEL